jgi:hypothetical protein
MALGQFLSEYFGFPANSHSTNCFTFINHRANPTLCSLDTDSVAM